MAEPVKTVYPNGMVAYKIGDKFHRIGGPAVTYLNGDEEYYENGEHHRIGAPAIDSVNSQQIWMREGKYYREPVNGEPMPVIVNKKEISYDGETYINITPAEFEKFKYNRPETN